MVITDDPLDLIREGYRRLQAEDRSGWSGPAQMDRATQLLQVVGEFEAEAARAAGSPPRLRPDGDDRADAAGP
jgi:hypothetical protein